MEATRLNSRGRRSGRVKFMPPPSQETYLRIDGLLSAENGKNAIHPFGIPTSVPAEDLERRKLHEHRDETRRRRTNRTCRRIRVSKSSLRVETYGTVDELNSILGLARSHCEDAGSVRANQADSA